MTRGRVLALLAASGAIGLLTAAPAWAVIDPPNAIGCSGSAVITAKGGGTTTVDAADVEAKVPREGSAAWRGSTTTATHDHGGAVRLKIGPFDVTVGRWGPSKNDRDLTSSSGTKQIPEAIKWVPAGKYKVSGFHQGKEGGCRGRVTLDIGDGAFDTPAGAVAVGGTVLSAAGLGAAARARRMGGAR